MKISALKVGIIGHGRVGKSWQKVLLGAGITKKNLSISNTSKTNKRVVQRSRLVLLAVPLRFMKETIERIVLASRDDHVFICLAGNMRAFTASLAKLRGGVVQLHQLHGPASSWASQNVPFHPVRVLREKDLEVLDILSAILDQAKSFRFQTTPTEHDRGVSNTQQLPHLLLHAFISVYGKRTGYEGVNRFSTPLFREMVKIAKRFAEQDPQLYFDMFFFNGNLTLEIIEALKRSLDQVAELISLGDEESRLTFEQRFKEASRRFAPLWTEP